MFSCGVQEFTWPVLLFLKESLDFVLLKKPLAVEVQLCDVWFSCMKGVAELDVRFNNVFFL